MRYCGLDLATRMGIAIFDGPALLHWEAFRPKGVTDAEIFHGHRVHLRPLLVEFGVEQMANEELLRTDLTRVEEDKETGEKKEVPIVTMKTFLRLYGIRAIVHDIAHSLNMTPFEVNQATWRKAFTGNGHASKADSVKQCKEFGWGDLPEDAAEACGVGRWLGGELAVHNGALPGDLFFNVA